jgi:glutathione synthase/RimK-type ligase-like ATP-grasp enzyme
MKLGKDKWNKHLLLSKKGLKAYLPATKRMNDTNLTSMLKTYKHIIMKPRYGKQGKGQVKISEKNPQEYVIQIKSNKKRIYGKKKLKQLVNHKISTHTYILQRFIPLAHIKRNPVDYRFIVQRKSNSRLWTITAYNAKIARKGYFVTNLSHNGSKLLVQQAISQSSIHKNKRGLQAKMKKVSLKASQGLSRMFPNHRLYGMDLGIDVNGKVWLIEANLWPGTRAFKNTRFNKMYRKIQRYRR